MISKVYNSFLTQCKYMIWKKINDFEKWLGFETAIKWNNVLFLGFMHVGGLIWSYFYAFPVKWQSLVFAYIMYAVVGASGILCGVHRYWTHRSYKAKFPLKVYLMLAYSSIGQNSIYDWVRDHRLHHKFSDTAADPHNASRGFWFSHIGWLFMKKNSLVIEKGKLIDMSDIEKDPIVMFEKRYSSQLSLIFCYILPTLVEILFWGEKWQCAVAWQCFIRVLVTFHSEMTVNSFAHMYGYKPYSCYIKPSQNPFVSVVSGGEGWHNYHHTFPWDYKAAEAFDIFNMGTCLINLWAWMGLAYDLKEPSPKLIQAVVNRRGNVEDRTIFTDDCN